MTRALLLAALLTGQAYAADPTVILHTASWHSHSSDSTNDENLGLGVAYPLAARTSVVFGAYRNSYDRASRYAMLSQTVVRTDYGRISVSAGFIDGYGRAPVGGNVALSAGPVTLIFVPWTPKGGVVLSLAFTMRIKP